MISTWKLVAVIAVVAAMSSAAPTVAQSPNPSAGTGNVAGTRAEEPTSATLTPEVLREIARVESEIDKIEEETLSRFTAPPDNQVQQIELLGKIMMPRCQANDAGEEGTTCWPAPESTENLNTKELGRLGLTDVEENALVSFMQTLTDTSRSMKP